jgi:hypothetical protein
MPTREGLDPGPLLTSRPARMARKQSGNTQKRKENDAEQAKSGGLFACFSTRSFTRFDNDIRHRATSESCGSSTQNKI